LIEYNDSTDQGLMWPANLRS